ncbi:hypothetical protein F5Y19DRAFT_402285 [Xylariaceae sp. FL1651]|nr:hypothetical protein F5Y19DRAFT_402285 [Xylariaceae sp. FL1651]
MDWPSHIDPFLYPYCVDQFICDREDSHVRAKNGLKCEVLQVFESGGHGHLRLERILLDNADRWEKWFTKSKIFPTGDYLLPVSALPRGGVCIL